MQLTEDKQKEYARKLIRSRTRILGNHGFFGMLLMHAGLSINDSFDTAATDGKDIVFSPDFLESLTDEETDFIMMHEIMHIVLKHCFRDNNKDDYYANIADDIVVNSILLSEYGGDLNAITVNGNVSMHTLPDGREGNLFTAEEVYDVLNVYFKKKKSNKDDDDDNDKDESDDDGDDDGKDGKGKNEKGKGSKGKGSKGKGGKGSKGSGKDESEGIVDNHSLWKNGEEGKRLDDEWTKIFEEVCETLLVRDPSNGRGTVPLFAERIFNELKDPKLDWRVILNNFIQEEIVDYSFSPPDKRYGDSPFFLPDFNEKDEKVRNVLFMIDTSGSMSDDLITEAYSEVKGAIDQFDGKLSGYLGFFDARVVDPKPFETEEEFRIIRPKGGGGTDFTCIFEYVKHKMNPEDVTTIIILTDGYAPFPDESATMGIPVLWVINNKVSKPPFGKIARI